MTGEEYAALPLSSLLDLTGKVAVVTGAAHGIGRACAARLAEAGATVYSADISTDTTGISGIEVSVDITDQHAVDGLVTKVIAETGRLDIWVNSAGIFPRAQLLDISSEEWRNVFEINVDGTFRCARAAGLQMSRGGGGVIVNIASTVAFRVNSNAAHYRATKSAMISLTQNLAVELGPKNVRALTVCPTVTRTEGLERLVGATGELGLDRYVKRLPLGRAALPDDVARVVLFAVSPLAAYVTGSTILVDGGEVAS